MMLLLPPQRFHGFQFMLDTFLAGAFMFAFLRDRKVSRFGALVGGLSFQLGNGLLTSARQGVLWVFDTACWVPLFLLFFSRILNDEPRRARNSALAGAFLGLQFLGGEIQVAYYVCLLAAAYFVWDAAHGLWSARRGSLLPEALAVSTKRLGWAALAAFVGIVFAAEVFCSYYSLSKRQENVGVHTEEENWDFATQFSFSPRKVPTLAFSGNIQGEGPLTGRDARLSDNYLGIVGLLFAFLGLLSNGRRRYFFACAAVAAVLISFGRYFPLPYRMIYVLPLMEGFRNPHKWLFITSLCVSILAGMGADYWRTAPASDNRRIFIGIAAFFAGMAVIAYLTPLVTGSAYMKTVSVVTFKLAVLAVASVLVAAGTKRAVLSGASLAVPAFVVALLAGDLIANASPFISYYDYRERYVEDETVKWLQSQPGPYRVKLWSETPYLRYLVTEVLPYAGIDTMDAIMSRRPGRYSEIFEAVRAGRLEHEKLFHLFNVKYILSATRLPRGFQARLAAVLRPPQTPEEVYIYELDDALPRVFLTNDIRTAKREDTIELLGKPGFDLKRTVLLEESEHRNASLTRAAPVPRVFVEMDGEAPVWSLAKFSCSPHRVSFEVSGDRPSALVLQDFVDADWRAFIDGEETPILPANYLMRAILVPGGAHMILFRYEPAVWGFVVTLAGWLAFVFAAGYMGARRMNAAFWRTRKIQ
jgi:hypothetical protein